MSWLSRVGVVDRVDIVDGVDKGERSKRQEIGG